MADQFDQYKGLRSLEGIGWLVTALAVVTFLVAIILGYGFGL